MTMADHQVEDDEELVDIHRTDWYRTRTPQMTAGKRLRIYRENAGLPLTRLSELSGIGKETLSQLEHDKRPLDQLTARQLARYLRCDYRSLLEVPVMTGTVTPPLHNDDQRRGDCK